MKTTIAAALATIAVVGIVLLAAENDQSIAVEPLQIHVTTSPVDGSTLSLDAQVYVPVTTPAPAVILAHGFGSDRTALDDDARFFADAGFVVLAYSARGFGQSEGRIGLNDPDGEVADVSVLVDVLAGRPDVSMDGPDDPRVGIAGGSYGGGLSLLAAATEPRLDAVVAAAAWNTLSRSLSPNASGTVPGVLKEQWASVLFASAAGAGLDPSTFADTGSAPDTADPDTLDPDASDSVDPAQFDLSLIDLSQIDLSQIDLSLIDLASVDLSDPALDEEIASDPELGPLVDLACGRFSVRICLLYIRAATTGLMDADAADVLDRASPAGSVADVTAPTMLISGLDDTLFGLEESLDTIEQLTAPAALRWVPGGHGEASRIDTDIALDWFAKYLQGEDRTIATFSWTDAAAATTQPSDLLPAELGDTRPFVLASPGLLTPDDVDTEAQSVPLINPPGGLPAAISTLPGLGSLGGLLPQVDLPGQSTTFTTSALNTDLTLVGRPHLRLPIRGAAPDGIAFFKLYDVTPGGQATLIHSDVNPVRLSQGLEELDVDLHPVAYRLVAGNRLRLTIATTDQAYATGRDAGLLAVTTGADAVLDLPVVPTDLDPGTPAVVRLALPVLVVLGLALLGLALIRRHERSLAAPPDSMEPPIVVRGLVKRYRDGKVAVDGLDLTVKRGQVYGLLGPNGAGKTTTMRMLLGLTTPTEGSIRILGQDMRPGHGVLHRVGVLVEGPGFAPYLTGIQNLESFWRAGGRPMEEADLDRALAVADLGAAIDKPTGTYSHGMRQRLAIAQALLGTPELLILDEPTDGLDPEQIKGMRGLLARLGEEGLTILVSSHLLGEVEQMCTHAAVVRAGTVVAAGPVAELVGANQTLVVKGPDLDGARVVLDELLGPDRIRREGDGLAVSLDGRGPSEVIAALVHAGVTVASAAPRGRLEDAFLELTSTDADTAASGPV